MRINREKELRHLAQLGFEIGPLLLDLARGEARGNLVVLGQAMAVTG